MIDEGGRRHFPARVHRTLPARAGGHVGRGKARAWPPPSARQPARSQDISRTQRKPYPCCPSTARPPHRTYSRAAGRVPATVTPFGISERLKKPISTSPLATSSPPPVSAAWCVLPWTSSRMPSLASAPPAMAPEVLGGRRVAVGEGACGQYSRFQLLGRRDVGKGRALLHDHTNADTRERDAAPRRETAGFVMEVHRRYREDDGIECLLREFLVDGEHAHLGGNGEGG